MKDKLLPTAPTARDLLEYIAGETHALHTVMTKTKAPRGYIVFTCSCGSVYKIEHKKEYSIALKNVPEIAS